MLEDKTTVTITVHQQHEQAFLKFLTRKAVTREVLSSQHLVSLTFHEWDSPKVEQFHCQGIPFIGCHGAGTSYRPHRICGDGEITMAVYASAEMRLYVFIDEVSGSPDWRSDDEVRSYLSFEKECLGLMQSPQIDTIE